MKLLHFFLFTLSLTAFSHEERNLPQWLRSNLNEVSAAQIKLNGKPLKYSTEKYDKVKVSEKIAGKDIAQNPEAVKSTLVKVKRVRIVDSYNGHEWDYTAGLFECEHPSTREKFEIWVTLKTVDTNDDDDKVAKSIVSSKKWKGLKFYSVSGSKLLTIAGTLMKESINVDGKMIHFAGVSCIYLNNEKRVVVENLPYRSYMKGKGVNGLMGYWYSFSDQYLVSDVQTSVSTLYGDRVTDLRVFFYDLKARKMKKLDLVLNIKDLSRQLPRKLDSGRKLNHYAEILEKPFTIVRLVNGKKALRMYLPSAKNREAGEYLIIPKF